LRLFAAIIPPINSFSFLVSPDSPCSYGHSSGRRYAQLRTILNVPVSSLEFGKVLVFEMWILRSAEES
jgi:hypothetical protein